MEVAMQRKLAAFVLFAIVLLLPLATSAQETDVRKTIDNVLKLLGAQDIDALAYHFTNDAVLIVARHREGKWTNTVETAEKWLARMKNTPDASPFEERLSNIEVTIDSGELAYVRADFEIVRDGKVISYGVDLFTLLRMGDAWKIAAISYTNLPGK
jgi:ketosteroid isomerase-like protein